MEQKTVTIKSITVSGPTTRKPPGKGSYMTHAILTTEGEEFKLFSNPGEPPQVNRKPVELSEGVDAQVILERQGRNVKVLDLSILGKNVAFTGTTSTPTATVVNTGSTGGSTRQVTTSSSGGITQLDKTSRDLSQEVSGIMQSLISTGKYHNTRTDPTTGHENTFVSDKILEIHTNLILEAKGRVIAGRSNKG